MIGASVKVRFNGRKVTDAMRADVQKRIALATSHLQAKVVLNISSPARQPVAGPQPARGSRQGRVSKYQTVHSREGEFPKAITGKGHGSIFKRFLNGGMVGQVGTNLFYMVLLEVGTAGGKLIVPRVRKALRWIDNLGHPVFRRWVIQGAIRGRSFLRRTLREESATLRGIFTRPLR
jgi:hypothetical protein